LRNSAAAARFADGSVPSTSTSTSLPSPSLQSSSLWRELDTSLLSHPYLTAVNRTYTKPNGGLIDYYEVKIQNYTSQVYPELGPAAMVGYDGISPGPTFVVKQGRETVVRFINIGNDKPTATHLHGSYSKDLFLLCYLQTMSLMDIKVTLPGTAGQKTSSPSAPTKTTTTPTARMLVRSGTTYVPSHLPCQCARQSAG
jgi:FtsP/CotA-like multicopper oxidase with cupredoxin domain